jgi:hypothetical protein
LEILALEIKDGSSCHQNAQLGSRRRVRGAGRLTQIRRGSQIRLHDIAVTVKITERAAQQVVAAAKCVCRQDRPAGRASTRRGVEIGALVRVLVPDGSGRSRGSEIGAATG